MEKPSGVATLPDEINLLTVGISDKWYYSFISSIYFVYSLKNITVKFKYDIKSALLKL